MIKPGWVRVNFNYFINEEEFNYIVEAVHLVAEHGWRLLPHYRFEPQTALWRHRLGLPRPPMSLFEIDYSDGTLSHPIDRLQTGDFHYRDYLDEAHHLFASSSVNTEAAENVLDREAEALRWFPLPHEVMV